MAAERAAPVAEAGRLLRGPAVAAGWRLGRRGAESATRRSPGWPRAGRVVAAVAGPAAERTQRAWTRARNRPEVAEAVGEEEAADCSYRRRGAEVRQA